MFTESHIANLFPIPVWVHTLAAEQAEEVNRGVLALLDGLRAAQGEIAPGQPWQTPNDLHKRPELEVLNGCVATATGAILDHLKVEYGSFLVTGCWANVMPKGSPPSPSHTHPNNFLSGVYYVQTPAGGDSMVFHDPKAQTNIIAPRVTQPNEHNSRNATLAVQAGTLIMFPAWLPHSVGASSGDGDRVSVGFNVMFNQFGEEMSQPMSHPPTGS
jgi:uncharacterized protein (TIGR02466 family)